MTAITGSAWAPGLGSRIRWGVSDTLTLTKRSLLVWYRVPAYIFFSVVQPVIFVLLFRYVFGGAIPVQVPGGYVNFLLPGIIAQTAAFATFGTAIVLAQELKKGVIDRLKSMPIARSAVLTGRLVADTGRMLVTILIIVGIGYAVGFRFLNGVGPAVAMVVVATVFGVAIACIAAFTGLAIGDEETVQSFGLIWLFPLTFVSSAFVPIATMPGWLQAFANHQPVTYIVNAMRAMALGGSLEPTLWPNLWKGLVWLAGIFVVFLPLAVRAYRRAALRRAPQRRAGLRKRA
jgi:ABC transporter DrrB family efflux protein